MPCLFFLTVRVTIFRMSEPDNQLILENLNKIQAGISDLRGGLADVRQDTHAIKDEIVSLRTIVGEFIKTDARRESDYLHLSARVERIERRLDLLNNPPPA
jgi:hypothetical protein